MPGLADAVGKHYGHDPAAPEPTEAELRAATDARSVEALGELVDDPWPGQEGRKVRPSLAGVAPHNREAHVTDQAFAQARKTTPPEPTFVYVDGQWQPAAES